MSSINKFNQKKIKLNSMVNSRGKSDPCCIFVPPVTWDCTSCGDGH